MTKLNLTKAALLAATAIFASTSAHAQVADTWALSDATVIATNSSGTAGDATVTLDGTSAGATTGIDGASIVGGFKNSISGAAVGASASFSFTSTAASGTAGMTGAATATGALSVTAGNDSAVLNTNDIATSAVIGGGNGNSISLAAVGSSASFSGSVSSEQSAKVAGTPTDNTSGITGFTGGTIQSGDGDTATGDITDLTAGTGGNIGTVTVNLANGIAGADIQGGNANSISVAGVGSSASFSLSSTAIDGGAVTSGFDTTAGDLNITSTNASTGTVYVGGADAATAATVPDAQIETGNGNSISVAAVGSSASFSDSTNSYGDAGTANTLTPTVTGGTLVATQSLNLADVTNSTNLDNSVLIPDGNSNSVSVAAVGSSASISTTAVDYTGSSAITNGPALTALSSTSNNSGNVTTNGTITGADIESIGYGNSVSVAGVGSSASISFTDTSYNGATGADANAFVATTLGATSTNAGVVAVNTGNTTPIIGGGYQNSISTAAVGASASISLTQTSIK